LGLAHGHLSAKFIGPLRASTAVDVSWTFQSFFFVTVA
jgi:hypothetical protein